MMDPALKQQRLGWLEDGRLADNQTGGAYLRRTLRVSKESDTLFFVGCAPYFDVQFGHMGVPANASARATVQILNALGIEPQVSPDERCCGHDLLWEGDVDGFRRLAELNAALVREASVSRVVTACPECARALRIDYPAHGIHLGVEVLHLAELLDASPYPPVADPLELPHTRVTYQDPCRLGRHLGVYEAPRQVISRLGLDLMEMSRHRENALCCGTNGWTHCGAANKQIQVERLREAQATGADVLITACLKCQIHLRCALQDRQFGDELTIELRDLTTLVAERLLVGAQPGPLAPPA
jgi:Fe-S oxidoreductase